MSALLRATEGRMVSIVLLTGIGDVVHGFPIANDLKRQDPGRTVLWVAEATLARILEHHPAVDEIVVFHRQRSLHGVIDRYTEQGATPDPSVYEPKRGRMKKIEVQDILEMVGRARSRYGVRKRERR